MKKSGFYTLGKTHDRLIPRVFKRSPSSWLHGEALTEDKSFSLISRISP